MRRTRKAVVAALLGAALTAVVLAAPATPGAAAATATTPILSEQTTSGGAIASHCPAGTLCVWVNPNFFGTHVSFWDTNSNWAGLNRPWRDVADNDESWCNFGTHPTLLGARAWQNSGHGGFWHQLIQGLCVDWHGGQRPANVGSSNSWHQHPWGFGEPWRWSTF